MSESFGREEVVRVDEPAQAISCGWVALPNLYAQPIRWWPRQDLEEGGHRLAHAARVFELDAARDEPERRGTIFDDVRDALDDHYRKRSFKRSYL